MANPLEGMTQAKWSAMSDAQRRAIRSDAGLTQQLVGLEGWRVEVVDEPGDKPRRFNVSRSTGWVPCHIELASVRSGGGFGARSSYHSVKPIRRVR